MHRRLMLGLACVALGSLATAQDSDRWMRLGQRDLDPRGERAEVVIARHPALQALVLGVDNASVRILDAKIQLDNGRVITWPIRGVLYPRQRTHAFRLPGPFERRIRRVVLYYETGASGRRPRGERFRQLDRNVDRGPYSAVDPNLEWDQQPGTRPQPGMERREPGPHAPDWERDVAPGWDRDWDRQYGRLKPRVFVWGQD
jgi:hypothetical protein